MNNRGPIWFGIVLVVIVAGIGAWIYFLQPMQPLNIGIQLSTTPSQVLVGDPFDLSVALTNNSASVMQSTTVEVLLPSDIVSPAVPAGQQIVTQSLAAIAPSDLSHQDFQLIATGSENTVVPITVKVLYSVTGSSAQFENDETINIPVGQAAVTASIVAPGTVFSGQNFPVAVTYTNNTDHAVTGFALAIQLPPAFTLTNGTSGVTVANLAAGGNGTITADGNLVGPNGGTYPIGATVGETISGQNYTIANPTANVTLAASPLMFAINVNNAQSYVSRTGDTLNYVLNFTNNSTVSFQNIVITAKLVGAMFNFASLSSDGTFNSVNDTLTWNGAVSPQLLSFAPGQSGSVSFSLRTKDAFPIRLLSDKNYAVNVNAELQSPTVPSGTDASSTISVADLSTKIGGAISLGEVAYHREPTAGVGGSQGASGIVNAGPYPPQVNRATQYTIHWLITNYATDADNVTISAYLQSGVACTGKMDVPASTTLTCDPSSGQVTWQIPAVPATTGIVDKPLEAVFQLTNTPAVNQVGQTIPLLGAATLTATDAFTSSTLQTSVGAIGTDLPDDTSVAPNNRAVVQ